MSDDRRPSSEPSSSGDGSTTAFRPDLVWRDQIVGPRPGDRVVRVTRHRYFRGAGEGRLVPRPEATEPHDAAGRAWLNVKRFVLGRPLPTSEEASERLSKVKALAVLSSDALSSVAYATEAAMRVLILGGIAALAFTLPISVVTVLLLVVVASSYWQTVQAYPSGGGSYVVALENLGVIPGLVAAASLMVGYVLTVAVSVAAGVYALISAFPVLQPYSMELALGFVVLITILNLRGARESGTIFAVPTYVFVASIFGLIGYGLFRLATGGIPYVPGDPGPTAGIQPLTWFLVISAFARGCSAMTGTEAIANTVPAFKPPESANARTTLAWMAGILAVMFIGISFLVTQIGIIPNEDETQTVLSELTRAIAGEGWYFYLVQFSTALILVLAANTCYAGFPWLLKVMARDGYAPGWFGMRGDRLVFSVGIIALALLASMLLLVFGGSVERLLPLYAIGVFTAFTLSQAGMVIHWLRGDEAGRGRRAAVNGIGAVATGIVTLVIGITNFQQGAWVVILVVPVIVVILMLIKRHYQSVVRQLSRDIPVRPIESPPIVLVAISDLNLVTRRSVAFARSLSPKVVAVHVAPDEQQAERIKAGWEKEMDGVPLVIIESPYRLVIPPLLAYVDALMERHPNDCLLVMLPEFVPNHWWEQLLHNQTALRLKASLLFRPGVVVASYPYQLEG